MIRSHLFPDKTIRLASQEAVFAYIAAFTEDKKSKNIAFFLKIWYNNNLTDLDNSFNF
jgi:hypothetical protein